MQFQKCNLNNEDVEYLEFERYFIKNWGLTYTELNDLPFNKLLGWKDLDIKEVQEIERMQRVDNMRNQRWQHQR
jgi:hypothetical protein